ncbi:hypothetical protein M9H77_04936 [Catharanthus roseus]|uniref:Uncharacterized protein n=1 Tax=Catharanthus roseus TaxID=4058 RepID=A0ACC0CFG3_CATRO|nr:hypothetical protein M9H77_04936 [Catharanthus roseus]
MQQALKGLKQQSSCLAKVVKDLKREEEASFEQTQPIKTWSLMKQSLKKRFGVGNHEEQRQGKTKAKFIESQWLKSLQSGKEEHREKEIVVFEKSEEVNFYANDANSLFATNSLCVQNFED